jgi:hypothetical protein
VGSMLHQIKPCAYQQRQKDKVQTYPGTTPNITSSALSKEMTMTANISLFQAGNLTDRPDTLEPHIVIPTEVSSNSIPQLCSFQFRSTEHSLRCPRLASIGLVEMTVGVLM